jgi:predicted ABC-class ATPase
MGLLNLDIIGFIGDGSVLPRNAGDSQAPLSDAIPWKSPSTMRIELDRPNLGRISGTAIKKGITSIIGGGFHGKSTLLQALSVGTMNKVPGDGREWVITDPSVMQIRSEDGRAVSSVSISSFIDNLPSKADTTCFSTTNASGSTSLAAAVSEALESQSQVLLFDEDTCATNVMIRDQKMHQLVQIDPIRPLSLHLRSLYSAKDVSCILVVGASSDLVAQSDWVVSMENYIPLDVTEKSRQVLGPLREPSASDIEIWKHCTRPRCVTSLPNIGHMKTFVKHPHRASIGETEWDVSLAGSGLIEVGQMRWLVDAISFLKRYPGISIKEAASKLETSSLHQVGSRPDGWYARPRYWDIVLALNRLRIGKINQL